MTRAQIVERMAEAVHNAWMQHYLSLGYTSRKAEWGEEFMVPYDQLSDRGKDLDRMIMRAILASFGEQDLAVIEKKELRKIL